MDYAWAFVVVGGVLTIFGLLLSTSPAADDKRVGRTVALIGLGIVIVAATLAELLRNG